MAREHAGQIRRARADARYAELLSRGVSPEQADRIAKSPPRKTARHGGRHSEYRGWSKRKLVLRARKLRIAGRSEMNKQQLINAILRMEALLEADPSSGPPASIGSG